MCSFGSCKTRFEFLSQFRKVRNAFECFVTQVQTHLPKSKRVWPMKINVICTVHNIGPINVYQFLDQSVIPSILYRFGIKLKNLEKILISIVIINILQPTRSLYDFRCKGYDSNSSFNVFDDLDIGPLFYYVHVHVHWLHAYMDVCIHAMP